MFLHLGFGQWLLWLLYLPLYCRVPLHGLKSIAAEYPIFDFVTCRARVLLQQGCELSRVAQCLGRSLIFGEKGASVRDIFR